MGNRIGVANKNPKSFKLSREDEIRVKEIYKDINSLTYKISISKDETKNELSKIINLLHAELDSIYSKIYN